MINVWGTPVDEKTGATTGAVLFIPSILASTFFSFSPSLAALSGMQFSSSAHTHAQTKPILEERLGVMQRCVWAFLATYSNFLATVNVKGTPVDDIDATVGAVLSYLQHWPHPAPRSPLPRPPWLHRQECGSCRLRILYAQIKLILQEYSGDLKKCVWAFLAKCSNFLAVVIV